MDATELRDDWEANNHRPQWVIEHRHAIQEHTTSGVPRPPEAVYQVREWLDQYQGTVTRQLREHADADDDGDSGETPKTRDAQEDA